jgi:hypothetical protein
MTTLIIVAAIATGLLVGWWLTLTVAAAAMSRSQSRMQRKVRYWQAEARRAKAQAEQLSRATLEQLVAPEKW